ncbi:MAG: T9SS type A sorting domain-containing protein [Burkholderiales bacterium]|nr:T9SS type A sorting domain-containing protein [Bacteroidia bacterium]
MKYIICALLNFTILCYGQTPYTSYFTGDVADVTTNTQYGVCLMGGATEDNNAMMWFLNKSGGGDIVVLRATGTNGYNSYLYSGVGVTVNSVETIVINSLAGANDSYVRQQIRNAEAVFIAGGNQFDYITYWKNTAVDSALNYLINTKLCPIGGTSAGMAIQGQAYFSAAVSSITSATALSDPYNSTVTMGNNDFLHHPLLNKVITDTHFDNPDRKGRLSVFLARLFQDSSQSYFGIACDEYTAVCIDELGIARVFGGFPTYDDNAYFIQANCTLPNNPENCSVGQPLTWNRNGAALKVYQIKGDVSANNSFNLNDWMTCSGGSWQNWSVNSGVISYSLNTSAPNCLTTGINQRENQEGSFLTPNPVTSTLYIGLEGVSKKIIIYNALGEIIFEDLASHEFDFTNYTDGMYYVKIETDGKISKVEKIIVKH